MAIEKRSFVGGINSDINQRMLPSTHSLNLMNCGFSISEHGRAGRVENRPGTTQISQAVVPPYGVNQCIGSATDEGTSRLIYCLWNSFGDHGIYCIDYTTPSSPIVYAVLYDSQVIGGLNFSKTSRIDKNARIVGNILYFTDNDNEPRRVNIDAGIKMNHAGYVTDVAPYSYPMNDNVITIIRKPPNYPLSFNKTTGGSVGITINNNQIADFSGKFCWFYEYRDGETSVVSPYSTLANYNVKNENYDVITVTANISEHIDQDVQRVVFGVIYSVDSTGFEIKTWDKANAADLAEINAHNAGSTPLTLQFTNSEVGAAISTDALSKPFDVIPRTSKTLDKALQRIYLANNLMGYNTPTISSLTATTVTSNSTATALKTGSSRRIGIQFLDKYQRAIGGVVPYSKLITVADKGFTQPNPYDYAVQWTLSNAEALSEIPVDAYYYVPVSTKDITRSFFLQAFAGDIFYASQDQDGVYSYDKTAYSSDNVGVAIRLNTLSGQGMGYTFTEGDLVNIRILYGSTVQSATLSAKSVQGGYLIAENHDFGTLDFLSLAVFEVYSPNNKTASNFYYEQGNIYKVINPTTNARTYGTTTGLIQGDVYILDKSGVNKLNYNIIQGNFVNSSFATLGASFVSDLATPTSYTIGNSPLAGAAPGFQFADNSRWILKTLASTVTFNIRGTLIFNSTNDNHFSAYFAYNDGSNETQTGIVPDFNTAGGWETYTRTFNVDITMPPNCRLYLFYSGGDHSVQIFSSSMVVTTATDGPQTRFECMSPNDKFYKNWFTNAGRLQEIDKIGEQRLKTAIRWSNTYLSNRNNGLSSFDALNQKVLQTELDQINKLQLANKIDELGQGNVMLAICTSETASLYLGEVQLMAAAKAGDVATSSDVIGSVNLLKGSYGTINPESVFEYLGLVSWIDALNGTPVQYSSNGLEPIGRYGNSRFWKLYLSAYLNANKNNLDAINGFHHLPSCIDPYYKEFLFTLPSLIYENYATNLPSFASVPSYATSIINRFDLYDQLGKTMAFCFLENKWGNNWEFKAEHYDYLQNTMFAFKNGVPYIHNADTNNWNTFYGTHYPVRVCTVANLNPSLLKDLTNIAVESSVAPDFAVAMTEVPNEQITDLASDDFTNQQGFFYAEWLRDRLSPNASGTAVEKLYSGDQLTDVAIMVMLEFQAYDELFWMTYLNMGFEVSRGQSQIADPSNKVNNK